MKFFALFATSALAAVVRRQSAADIPDALAAISAASEEVQAAIDAYEGGDAEFEALQEASAGVLAAIADATETVEAVDAIEVGDAIGLTGPTEELVTSGEATIDALIEKQPIFAENDDDAQVLENLQTQQTASAALSAAISERLPVEIQGIAAENSAPIAAALERGIEAFSGAADMDEDDEEEETPAPMPEDEMMPTPTDMPEDEMMPTPSAPAPAPTGDDYDTPMPAPTGDDYDAPMPEYTGAASAPVAGFAALAAAAVFAVI